MKFRQRFGLVLFIMGTLVPILNRLEGQPIEWRIGALAFFLGGMLFLAD